MAGVAKSLNVATSTGTGRQAVETADVVFPNVSSGRSVAAVGCLSETVAVSAFTDGGSTAGTYVMAGSIPAGAIVLLSKITPIAGFAGDTTAAITVGDGSDVDRYHTGTPSVFATLAVGVECGIVSGIKLLSTANSPTLTVTSSTDFTLVKTNASGIVAVSIFYLEPVL
jgi:hypothetical protein